MARFTLPRDLYHGKGSLAELKNLGGKKAILVVGGGSMKRQGFLDKAIHYLKEFGIIEEEFKEKIALISELAVGDACTGSNPRAIDPATMERLFTCVYYGTEVDF